MTGSALSGKKYKAYAEYKDSGSKWLDEIPSNWKVTALKHVLSIPITDGPHSTPVFLDEGIPFVSAEAVSGGFINFNKIRGFISAEDDLLFSQKYSPLLHDVYMIKSGATTGITAILETDKRFNIWSPLAVMRCKNSFDPYFLLNYLRSDSFQKSVQLSWTFGTQQNIGMSTLENLTVCYPPIEEQQKIANFLDHETAKIDTLITKQEKLIELLKEKRQAVISHAVTKGLNPNTALKDSGVEWLRKVPEHWDVATVRRFLLEHRQGYYTTESYIDDGTKLLRITDLKSLGEISIINCPKVPDHSTLPNYYLKEGDVVFARTGGAGSFGVIPKLKETVAYASYLIRFRFIPEHFTTDYLRFMLIADSFQLAVKRNIHGGVTQNIHAEDIKDTFVCCPPLNEQLRISNFLNESCTKYELLISKAIYAIDLMKERKVALISAAVTGKIDVRDWQK